MNNFAEALGLEQISRSLGLGMAGCKRLKMRTRNKAQLLVIISLSASSPKSAVIRVKLEWSEAMKNENYNRGTAL